MSKPYVTADNTTVTDFGVSTENGCVCVYDTVIADIGMTLNPLDGIAVLVKLKAFRT